MKGDNLTGQKLIKEAMVIGKPVISYSPKLFSFADYYLNACAFPVKHGTHLLMDNNFDGYLIDNINKYIHEAHDTNPIDISKNLLMKMN